MKTLLLSLLAGLVIGLGASSALILYAGVDPEPLTTSLAKALGTHQPDTPVDTLPPVTVEPVMPGEAEEARVAGLALDEPAPLPEVTAELPIAALAALPPAPEPPPDPLPAERLARLYGSMQPREAARVLEQLDDFEVRLILGHLGNREAAAILGNLSPERAAEISRTVLRPERSSQ
jgi:hypothetical protein